MSRSPLRERPRPQGAAEPMISIKVLPLSSAIDQLDLRLERIHAAGTLEVPIQGLGKLP